MSSQPATNLDDLSTRYPLPIDRAEVETFSDVAVVSGVSIHLAGFAATIEGECVTGSAAALEEVPFFRAYMELVERLSILVSMRENQAIALRSADGARLGLVPSSYVFPASIEPDRWQWSRSNGVAVAGSWRKAANRARWELIERDRVLRSFYGEISPRRLAEFEQSPAGLGEQYDFQAYAFDTQFQGGSHAVGVFAVPRGDCALTYGFAARSTIADAATAAGNECMQRLGFLFGEAIPSESPSPAPTPDFHQEHFLFPGNHAVLRSWLRGEHERFRGCMNPAYVPAPEEPRYADLTPPALEGRLFVARALPCGHVPLAFGVGVPMLAGSAPANVAVHPIA